MRHNNAGRKLGRNPSHRKALFRNMAKALLVHGRITTTEAKAKSLRGVVEPLITLALKNDLHARRQAYRVLGCQKLVHRLFNEIGPVFSNGGGGYTRVIKLAVPRKGDAAPMAIIELTKQVVASGAETVVKDAPKKAEKKVTAKAPKAETKATSKKAPAKTTKAKASKENSEE